jgi:hypothetical protein
VARDLFSPVGILDETHGAVARVAAPWLGVLWLSTAPYRFAQIHFIRELAALGQQAPDYGGYLERLAWILFALFVPAVVGRSVYVRACLLGLQSGARVGREGWRVPPAQLLNALYAALVVELLFALTVWTFVMVPFLAAPAGLVYVAATRTERPGLFKPLFETARLMANLRALGGILATYAVALLIAMLNLYMALRAGLWVATTLLGDGVARWEHLLRPVHPLFQLFPGEPLTMLLCIIGAMLVVEPFWLASLTVYVHRTRLRQSGEDLRLRFRVLTGQR